MWLVFVIIALATASFILMDAQGPGGGGTMNSVVGSVGGEKIKQVDFERAYSALFGNSGDVNAGRASLWNYLVEKSIVEQESELLGTNVGYDELMDLQFGTNISPVIRQNFTNQQTGRLDVAQLQQIKNQIEAGNVTNPQFAQYWREQEKQIKTTQLQTKISSMVDKAIYTPNWLAESTFKEENSTVDIAVVKIPFDNIPAGDITVSDADITAYAAKDMASYELDAENRIIDYVVYDVLATAKDSAQWSNEVSGMIDRFRTAKNDSTFAIANNGFFSPFFSKLEELDEFYQDKVGSFEIGEVYGPYQLGPSYQAVKLIDKRVLPDSVKAAHILRRVTPGNVEQLAEANRLADSLMTVLQRNKSKFGVLAEAFSEDLSNNTDGGDLGYFAQGRMVKEFNDVAFLNGKEGSIYKVSTQYGIHLIYIQDKKYLDRSPRYQLAYVGAQIIPSRETQDDAYNVMLDLISSYPYLEELKTAVDASPTLSLQSSNNLVENDYIIQGLGSGTTSREIVKFAFSKSSSIGDVSPTVYSYTDPVAYYTSKYAVVGLSKVLSAGMPSASDLRNQLEFAVLNELKGNKALAGISSTDLNAIASQYNTGIDTLRGINLLNSFVAGLGNEPKVIGRAFGQNIGDVSAPILGNSGVFVLKTISKNEAGAVSGLSSLKNSITFSNKSKAGLDLFEALKKNVKIKDGRAKFY